jgi:hypothetical protein
MTVGVGRVELHEHASLDAVGVRELTRSTCAS